MKKIDWSNLVVKGTEWFASLALLNVCWLLYSLPILTVIPATDTVFELLKQWEIEEIGTGIPKQFHRTFKNHFKKSYKIGVPVSIIMGIIIIDIYFLSLQSISSPLFQILKYAFYTFSILITLAILYAIPLMKKLERNDIKMLIIGLGVAVRNPLITLTAMGGVVVLIAMCTIWPSMLFFFSVSGVAWMMTKASSKVIAKEQEKRINESSKY